MATAARIEWAWIESFGMVARAGSLSDAAKLGRSQPTLSRHVSQLEEHLGVALFDRTGRGLRLTPVGEELAERAVFIEGQVDEFCQVARGFSEEVEGTVRVSVSALMQFAVLSEWMVGFRAEHPQISIECVVDEAGLNLLERQADISVRTTKPERLELIGRRVGEMPVRFYASRAYAERCEVLPAPDIPIEEHDWVGWDDEERFIRSARQMGVTYERSHFSFRSDDRLAQLAAIRHGWGIGVLWAPVGDADDGLVEVMQHVELPDVPLWVVAHRGVRTNPRVRIMFDSLCDYLEGFVSRSARS